MAVDFSFPAETEEIRRRVRQFVDTVVAPAEERLRAVRSGDERTDRRLVEVVAQLRRRADPGGPFVLNCRCQAPTRCASPAT